jgi:membrane-bound lytic murein transglycosylase A
MNRGLWLVLAALSLAACAGGRIVPQGVGQVPRIAEVVPVRPVATTPVAPAAPTAAAGTTARSSGAIAGPDLSTLPIDEIAARRALTAFLASCPAVTKRTDLSGLTRNADWARTCEAASKWDPSNSRSFFIDRFETVQVGTGAAFATGYYEPEIEGSRTRSDAYPVPIYRRPAELVEIDLTAFNDGLKGKKLSGRIANGTIVPFADRGQIEDGALAGRGLEIAWAADPVEFFMFQVQGSGRLRLPDGSIMRLTYAGQNGRTYNSVGAYMRERQMLQPGQYTMQGVVAYMKANPEKGRAIMRENKSFVFFSELNGEGPLGSLNIVVKRQASVATDPMFVPLGAPVFLSMDRADASGLWVAQDIGGAIKGANRFDTFWGAGEDAKRIAGGMTARGTAFVLVPKGTLARLAGNGGTTP